MKPLDLVHTSRKLVGQSGRRRPRQSDLKRAISTGYYAVFHQLCANTADCLIGATPAIRQTKAWRQAYRAVDHSFAKRQCEHQQVMARFPAEIQDFANTFAALQSKRHDADYDPWSRLSRTSVVTDIDAAEKAIKAFKTCDLVDRRAFAAWVTLKSR